MRRGCGGGGGGDAGRGALGTGPRGWEGGRGFLPPDALRLSGDRERRPQPTGIGGVSDLLRGRGGLRKLAWKPPATAAPGSIRLPALSQTLGLGPLTQAGEKELGRTGGGRSRRVPPPGRQRGRRAWRSSQRAPGIFSAALSCASGSGAHTREEATPDLGFPFRRCLSIIGQ